MKKYQVNVNGTDYEVTLELIEEGAAAPKAAPKAASEAPKATPKPKAADAAAGKGEQIKCPMPGTIIAVNVQKGESVKKNQKLCILEAMKMENEIVAPKDGVITSVNVQKGDSVDSGTLLCVIG